MSGRDERRTPKITLSEKIMITLQDTLITNVTSAKQKGRSILISSNSLANQFILKEWGIKPSQRRTFEMLFDMSRKRCSEIFHELLSETKIECNKDQRHYVFGVYRFDEIRANLILGFIAIKR